MLIGDGGTHKTWFAGHAPKPYFFDFDQGMAILRNVDPPIDYDTFKEAGKGQEVRRFGLLEYGTGWFAFIRKLNEIGAMIDAGTCPYETLVFDSFTYMAELATNCILKQANHETMTQPDWGSFLSFMTKTTQQIMAWPLRKIFTAHIKRDVNEITSTTEKLPLLSGQFAGKAHTLFDEVYYCETTGLGPNRKFVLTTEGDGITKMAKSRWGVPSGLTVDWKSVEPYITGSKSVEPVASPIKHGGTIKIAL